MGAKNVIAYNGSAVWFVAVCEALASFLLISVGGKKLSRFSKVLLRVCPDKRLKGFLSRRTLLNGEQKTQLTKRRPTALKTLSRQQDESRCTKFNKYEAFSRIDFCSSLRMCPGWRRQ